MTKFSYSEVQPAYDSSQSARLECLANFETIESKIDEFSATTELTGGGWDSAKQALAAYPVVSKALYNYHCDFGEIFAKFLSNFESEVGETSKTLDTEELAELQEKITRIQKEKEELISNIAGNMVFEIVGGYGVRFKDYQIDQTQKKVDILEKYQEFETTHASDFSATKEIGSQIQTALSELGTKKQFNAQTGSYEGIDYSNSEWYKNLSDYNDSCPSQRMEIVTEHVEPAGHPTTIYKVYVNGKYNQTATDNLNKLVLEELGETLKNLAGEFTGVYDLYRLFTGKDPVTGNEADRLEAGLWVAVLLLPEVKMLEVSKELRAGNRLLQGLDLTADELKILNKAGYFDDVAKISTIEKASGASYETGGRYVNDPYDEFLKWEKAEDKYKNIRNSTDDTAKIAENTGISKNKIERIKEHVFYKEHVKDHGTGLFDADPDMADAWDRLTNGNFNQKDLDLLEHEYFESRFESLFDTNYRTAHDKTIESGREWIPWEE